MESARRPITTAPFSGLLPESMLFHRGRLCVGREAAYGLPGERNFLLAIWLTLLHSQNKYSILLGELISGCCPRTLRHLSKRRGQTFRYFLLSLIARPQLSGQIFVTEHCGIRFKIFSVKFFRESVPYPTEALPPWLEIYTGSAWRARQI